VHLGEYLLEVCWALWLGTIVFFSFVVAPTIHSVLDSVHAAAVLNKLFPRYYLTGAICGLLATIAGVGSDASLRVTAPLLAATVITIFARQRLAPDLDKTRTTNNTERFAQLHTLSVRLNMIVLALLVLVGFGFGVRS